MPQTWSLTALALELERDRQALARALKDLPPDEERKSGRGVDRRWKLARVFNHLTAGSNSEFDDQRERLAAAQAEKVEMDNAVRRGQLADMNDVVRTWTDHIAAARAKLLSLPTKLSPQITNVADAAIIAAAIRSGIYEALAELAVDDDPSGRRGEGGDEPRPDGVAAPAKPNGKRVVRRVSKAQ